MRKYLLQIVLIVIVFFGCNSTSKNEIATKKELETIEELTIGLKQNIVSTILNEERSIIISLPKGYEDSNAKYPVLYLTDGLQNIWHVTGAIELLTRTGSIPPMIVVGIESVDRTRDFTLTANNNNNNNPKSGGGKKFLSFIEEELIPYVESNYRTNTYKLLEGHSLGGLFTVSTLMENPSLFNGFIIMSPSLWWNNEELTEKAKDFFKTQTDLDKALFLGVGTYESGPDFGMRKELKNFVDIIAENRPENLRFEHKELEKEGHMSSTLLSNYYGLKFIFSDMAFPEDLYENYTNEKFLKHENYIMNKYGKAAKQSAESYVNLAINLMQKEKYPEAITVLERSIAVYSFDVGLISFLASIHEKNNDMESAINTYKKAIETSKENNYNREEEFEKQINRLVKEKNKN